MAVSVGVDVAKEDHWITAINEDGTILLDRRVRNEPQDLDRMIVELRALPEPRRIGLDVVGGIAALVCATLLDGDERLFHVPGVAVNRARTGTARGEMKSDPKDARIIADQVRIRSDLRAIEPDPPVLVHLRLLVARRRDLVTDQTRRLSRLHDLLVSVHPALEHRLDLTTKAALTLLTRYVTPSEIRTAGLSRVRTFLGRHLPAGRAADLADKAMTTATAQQRSVPGDVHVADMVRELASEALVFRARLTRLEHELEVVVTRHPSGALIRSLPGMGVALTAELLAEVGSFTRFRSPAALAAAAGLAPVLRQSGKMRFLRRTYGGNKTLKRVFYQSAFCSLHRPESRAFYDRKRREGKRHHQAVLALARRRIDVLCAILREQRPYTVAEVPPQAA